MKWPYWQKPSYDVSLLKWAYMGSFVLILDIAVKFIIPQHQTHEIEAVIRGRPNVMLVTRTFPRIKSEWSVIKTDCWPYVASHQWLYMGNWTSLLRRIVVCVLYGLLSSPPGPPHGPPAEAFKQEPKSHRGRER